jgi:hypothetical protein
MVMMSRFHFGPAALADTAGRLFDARGQFVGDVGDVVAEVGQQLAFGVGRSRERATEPSVRAVEISHRGAVLGTLQPGGQPLGVLNPPAGTSSVQIGNTGGSNAGREIVAFTGVYSNVGSLATGYGVADSMQTIGSAVGERVVTGLGSLGT